MNNVNKIFKKKGNVLPTGSSIMFSRDELSLPFSSFYINAPCCDDTSFAYSLGDHLFVPVELKQLTSVDLASRDFCSVFSCGGSVSFSSLSLDAVVVRRYFDLIHYAYVVSSYDLKLSDGTYIFGIPEFLLFSSPDLSLLDGCYLVCPSGYLCLVSMYDESIDDSPIFDASVPSIESSLSSNFLLSEFLRSDCCSTSELYRSLTRPVYDNLVRLVEFVLQPARSSLGCPIFVSSGFRTSSVNRLVGGSARSYHLIGRAADVYVPTSCSCNNNDLYDILSDLPHVELIRYSSFIHVAF